MPTCGRWGRVLDTLPLTGTVIKNPWTCFGFPQMAQTNLAKQNCALVYGPDGFRIDRKAIKGRHSAGAGFLKGFIEHSGADRLVALTGSEQGVRGFPRVCRRTRRPGACCRPGRSFRQPDLAIGRYRLPAGAGAGGDGLDPQVQRRAELQPLRRDPHHRLGPGRRRAGAVPDCPHAAVGRVDLHLHGGAGGGRTDSRAPRRLPRAPRGQPLSLPGAHCR